MIRDSLSDLIFYLMIYAFLGWTAGVGCLALRNGSFVNRGFLNLPVALSEGITAVILLLALPTMKRSLPLQFLLTWVVVFLMDELTRHTMTRLSHRTAMAQARMEGMRRGTVLLLRTTEALVYLMGYLLLHPFVMAFVAWLPDWLVTGTAVLFCLILLVDYLTVRHTLRSGAAAPSEAEQLTHRLGDRLSSGIWHRLEKAYPGIERLEPENRSRYTFAEGMCFDKLVWVFLISSFLGAMIEMVYCRVVGGSWMNRSSVLYGAFSFVWGFGAVLLTLALQRFAGKPDRYLFLAGFVVGGVYEYLCSVFTEIVFGTVFWDYSHMPLNIGGRTNVLFCIFWGILSVLWIKVLYPPMERTIEAVPPLMGKVVTWVILMAMICNGLLTSGAMVRYTQRQEGTPPSSIIGTFLDEQYDDRWMEHRWPNMNLTQIP